MQSLIDSAELMMESGDDAEVFEDMRIWLVNEKNSPELLPGGKRLESMVERAKSRIESEEEKLMESDVYTEEYSIRNTELNRLKFLVTSLMRTRLFKLETLCEYVKRTEIKNINNSDLSWETSTDEEIHSALKIVTPSEWKFLQKFSKLRSTYFDNSFINQTNVDVASKGQGKDNIVPFVEPDWFKYLFCEVVQDLGTVTLTPFNADPNNEDEDELELELPKGTIFFIQYRMIRTLLFEGKVKLV
ncbi:predicted protein [Naegleria gruberi]|uniref:DNA replication complex GINS protein SLD5 n=1 Tax=Naegleria gruberi TaxID=5762 RepID=D2VA76_NAEGR|nr:uncharacterized protein NAEGRDRAFT_65763 [Naegleria gruberi]EFC46380.1 predicted protein [Naegleria gruberi]|eukprot:XP_002679124.1 predicted protein [Naegleria gruberi strain NEG-M]